VKSLQYYWIILSELLYEPPLTNYISSLNIPLFQNKTHSFYHWIIKIQLINRIDSPSSLLIYIKVVIMISTSLHINDFPLLLILKNYPSLTILCYLKRHLYNIQLNLQLLHNHHLYCILSIDYHFYHLLIHLNGIFIGLTNVHQNIICSENSITLFYSLRK